MHIGPFGKQWKVPQHRFQEHYGQHSRNGNDDWQFTLVEQCGTHEPLKEREHFGNIGSRHFTLTGLKNRKNTCTESQTSILLIKHIFIMHFNLFFLLL